MWLYHWIRRWSGFEHQTLWIEIQAIATLAAFAAAWWYAKIAKRQTDAIVSQQRLAEKDYIERNKPVVYIDRAEGSEAGNARYIVRNVGGGFAVNTYVFDVTLVDQVAAGSLAAGEERTLPAVLNRRLCDNGAGSKHLVIAEAPFTRTTQWTPTLNLRTQSAGSHKGQVIHRSASVAVEAPRFVDQSLSEYLKANVDTFRVQLRSLTEE